MNWKPAKRLELDSKHMQELNIRLNIKYDRTDGIRVAFSCFHGKKIISCSRWIQQFIFEPAANEWNARCTYADKIDAPSFPKNEPRPSSGSRLKKPAPQVAVKSEPSHGAPFYLKCVWSSAWP